MRGIKKLPQLIAYYPLSETSGTIAINYALSYLNQLNGGLSSGNIAQNGRVGRDYTFNQGTFTRQNIDYTGFSGGSLWGGSVSIFMILNLISAPGGDSAIFDNQWSASNAGGFQFYARSTTSANFSVGGTAGYDGIGISGTLGTAKFNMIHLTSFFNGTNNNMIIYMNGTQNSINNNSGTVSPIPPITGKNLRLGASQGTESWTNIGVQHVGIVARAQSANEIRKLAHFGGFI